MAVALRATASANSGTTTPLTLAPNIPTGTAVGDLLICNFASNSGITTTVTATGWTALPGFVVQTNSNTIVQNVLYRIADGTEGSSVTFTQANARICAVNVAGYSGVDPNNPFAGFAQSTSATSTTVTFPGATPQCDSVYAVALACTGNITSADTVSAASSGYTVSADTCSGPASRYVQAFVEDSHTPYTIPIATVTPGTATITPNVANQCRVTLLLRASIAGATTPTIDFIAGVSNGSSTFTSPAITTGYANEFVLASISMSTYQTVTSVTDTAGNTYTRAGVSSPSRGTDVWYTLAASAMTGNVITFNGISAISNVIEIYTFVGADTTSASAALGTVATTSGSAALDVVSVTTTRNNSRVASFSIANSNTTPTAAASNSIVHSSLVGASEGIGTISTAVVASSGTNFTAGIATPASTSFAIVGVEVKAPVAVAGGVTFITYKPAWRS